MSHHYGPAFLMWMPDPVIAEHWRRYPDRFGTGPEAVFLAWMNGRYGAGWQTWVPPQVVKLNWFMLFGD